MIVQAAERQPAAVHLRSRDGRLASQPISYRRCDAKRCQQLHSSCWLHLAKLLPGLQQNLTSLRTTAIGKLSELADARRRAGSLVGHGQPRGNCRCKSLLINDACRRPAAFLECRPGYSCRRSPGGPNTLTATPPMFPTVFRPPAAGRQRLNPAPCRWTACRPGTRRPWARAP